MERTEKDHTFIWRQRARTEDPLSYCHSILWVLRILHLLGVLWPECSMLGSGLWRPLLLRLPVSDPLVSGLTECSMLWCGLLILMQSEVTISGRLANQKPGKRTNQKAGYKKKQPIDCRDSHTDFGRNRIGFPKSQIHSLTAIPFCEFCVSYTS
jgi:hypothetical protein